jgi:hypothetical protein
MIGCPLADQVRTPPLLDFRDVRVGYGLPSCELRQLFGIDPISLRRRLTDQLGQERIGEEDMGAGDGRGIEDVFPDISLARRYPS